MAKIVVTQGLQFGSEAKGQISGMIADQWDPDVVVCANHPNAGHTYHDRQGHKFVHRILPVGAATRGPKHILIGPGAVIDWYVLMQEIMILGEHNLLEGKQLIIHPNASILLPEHVETEKELVRIGSTMKGSMAAVVQKMQRQIDGGNIYVNLWDRLASPRSVGMEYVKPVDRVYDEILIKAKKVLVEGAQGFSLGIHERFYPYCTSRDVSTHQVLADCRIPFGHPVYVHGVARTFPIRVANRFNKDGLQVGTSGPHYLDQREMEWAEINRPAELTTVTRLPRRLFSFSHQQVSDSINIMGANSISLTFCDYMEDDSIYDLTAELEALATDVISTSHGPAYTDVYDFHTEFFLRTNPVNFARHIEKHFNSL